VTEEALVDRIHTAATSYKQSWAKMMDLKWACLFFMACGIAHSEWVWEKPQEDAKPLEDAGEFRGYKSLGCWMDQGWVAGGPRAMDWSGISFDRDQVDQCFGEAASRGYKYFAVQANSECYVSNTDNYKRYGTSTGCSANGAGGDWANSVYEVKGPGYRSNPLGCWSDTDHRAIEGGFQHFDDYVYNQCFATAIWNGKKYFAIQDQHECFTTNDASEYKTYGEATGCKNGLGGTYKNDVHEVVYDGFSYKSLGCFSDRMDADGRAIVGHVTYFGRDVVWSCKQLAADRGNYYFAVQHGNECRTFDDQDYDRYGTATGCQHGTGSDYQNNVYKLLGE